MHLASLLLVLIPIALTGCGGSLPASVSGKVTLDGQPLPPGNGSVSFIPVGAGRVSNGAIVNGVYTLESGDEQGVQVGDYIPTVTVRAPADEPPPGMAPPAPKVLTPVKYGRKETSDLKATVKPGQNTIDLELKSK